MEITRWQLLRTRFFLFAIGIKRHVTLGARVVMIDGDKVLVVQHGYLPGWHFPGGGVEPGETAAQCAARETAEETGTRPTAPLELFGFYHNASVATNRDHVALYLCRHFQTVTTFQPGFEIKGISWISRHELPDDLEPGTARRIAEIFDGVPRSETW